MLSQGETSPLASLIGPGFKTLRRTLKAKERFIASIVDGSVL
jgi:hypothetical protein